MKEDIAYTTVFRNERNSGVLIYDRLGQPLLSLGPGKEISLDAWTKDALYAPFSEVVWKANGSVETRANPLYPKPTGRWLLTVENIDGRDLEKRIIGGAEVVLPKGIPRIFELAADDPMAVLLRVDIKNVMERIPSRDFPGYNEFVTRCRDVATDRDEKALEALAAELEKHVSNI